MILVTGGAGFIGSNFVRCWLESAGGATDTVVNLDKLTYAGNPGNLKQYEGDKRHILVHGDIGDRALTDRLFAEYRPQAVVNFAAESHVDRSIVSANDFIQTNVVGTVSLLQSARDYWSALPEEGEGVTRSNFRFLHVSTDEVYGSLEADEHPFTEENPHKPNSPYSASKAASDHFVRAWHHTYGLPVLTTNCSNNYGPYQFPEKLIPLVIVHALEGKTLPIYGDGLNIRDWLFVDDHCYAIMDVLAKGRPGETYNVGGNNEITNIDVIKTICAVLDELRPRADGRKYEEQIGFVKDRLGHDRRYAIDPTKILRELNWKPAETFATGIRRTVRWYLDNADWIKDVTSGTYREWIKQQRGRDGANGS